MFSSGEHIFPQSYNLKNYQKYIYEQFIIIPFFKKEAGSRASLFCIVKNSASVLLLYGFHCNCITAFTGNYLNKVNSRREIIHLNGCSLLIFSLHKFHN
jgi:hypothetical protein